MEKYNLILYFGFYKYLNLTHSVQYNIRAVPLKSVHTGRYGSSFRIQTPGVNYIN
jgi:hypothetical protein